MPPSPRPPSPFEEPAWSERIAKWCEAWGLPELPSDVRIETSSRMRVSLGRCSPRTATIRIALYLLDGPLELLEEVVCHELAHVAAHRLHDHRIAPHGPEWKALMRVAGREPRARIPEQELEALAPLATSGRVLWEHQCPRCHVRRNGGRPVKEWRCGRCQRVGLSGRLVVRRLGGVA